MARDLSAALLPEQIAEICERFTQAEFGAAAAILLADLDDHLQAPLSPGHALPEVDSGIAQWAFDHGEAAGSGTDTLPASPILYLPLQAPMRVRGVLALELSAAAAARLLAPEQRRLLDTFGRLIAIAIERLHYVTVAQETTVQMESERLRNSLLSALSHDLRTPLTGLVGLSENLMQQLIEGQERAVTEESAAAIRREALRINALVNNLLDMARLQAGEVRLNRQWQPLEEVVGSALQSVGPLLRGHGVSIELPDDLPLLEFDAVLLERVLANLLENAAKYTPPGSHVALLAEPLADEVRVLVEDDGPGLPAGKEEEIFSKFTRGQKESATSGVGLGLAICRAVLTAHGGRIWAENRPEGGARFIFTLPRGTPPRLEAHELPAPLHHD
jgi:two-component system sensor histidine kinase KdpD